MNDQEREHHKIRITFAKPAVVSDFSKIFWALSFATLTRLYSRTDPWTRPLLRPGARTSLETDQGSSTPYQAVVCSRPVYISIPTVGRVLSNQHYKMTQYLHIAATKPPKPSWSYYRQYDSIIVIKRHLENCLNFWGFKNWDVSTQPIPRHSSF